MLSLNSDWSSKEHRPRCLVSSSAKTFIRLLVLIYCLQCFGASYRASLKSNYLEILFFILWQLYFTSVSSPQNSNQALNIWQHPFTSLSIQVGSQMLRFQQSGLRRSLVFLVFRTAWTDSVCQGTEYEQTVLLFPDPPQEFVDSRHSQTLCSQRTEAEVELKPTCYLQKRWDLTK